MGLTTQDVGVIYGTFELLALTIGGILGGIVISRDG
jgi:PAT family beta-lactamase induction signal transducer AmpG